MPKQPDINLSDLIDEDYKNFIRSIPTDDYWELLQLVMSAPEYLTDSYYRDFGNEMRKKFDQMLEVRQEIEDA